MGERILVVDDEDTLRGVICQVLADDGHQVTPASSGEEGLAAFERERYPLVVTDIYMGKMNGIDLLQAIKERDADTMVVVMTSNASLETATLALRAGAYDYLTKPFDDLDLISAVVNRATDRIRLIRDNHNLIEELKRNAEELALLNERLRNLANRDGLTELFNHRYFREALDLELARAQRYDRTFSVIFTDIDHFKHYNDTHGHLAGDEVLRQIARLLQEHSRKSTVAARYGGEEFVLVVPETDAAGAKQYAETIRQRVESQPFPGRESQPLGKITLSLGVATFPADGADCGTLIDHADRALYASKRGGRNTVRAWSELGQETAAV